jgi:hypothetical protein
MECPKHSLHAHVGLMWPGPGWCIHWFQVRYSSFVCHALRDLVTTWPNRPLFLPHGRKVWTGICWRLVLLCVWVVYEGWTCLLFARPEHTEGIKSEPAFVDSRLVVLLVGKSELAFAEGLVLLCVPGSLWRLTARRCSCAWVHSTRQTMSLSSMPSVCTRRPEHTLRKNWHLLIQSRLVLLLVGKSELAFAEGLVLMCVLGSLWRLTARCCSCAWVHSTRQTMSLSSMPSVCKAWTLIEEELAFVDSRLLLYDAWCYSVEGLFSRLTARHCSCPVCLLSRDDRLFLIQGIDASVLTDLYWLGNGLARPLQSGFLSAFRPLMQSTFEVLAMNGECGCTCC